jgi:hypothetical protein
MLPQAYGIPAAIFLVLGGALACFAGYRLFRLVLGIYGFILGAMLASSMVGAGNNLAMLGAALVGGIAGSIVLIMAYFVGVALLGAGLGALIGHVSWTWFAAGDPPTFVVVIAALAGAAGAMLLQRYVIIASTAFAGAWTMVVGITNILAARGITKGASATEVWILYPTSVPEGKWVPYIWLALGLAGLTVQLALTAGRKRR